jgi:hypothetical protein
MISGEEFRPPFNYRLHRPSAVVTPLVPSGAPTRRVAPAALAGGTVLLAVYAVVYALMNGSRSLRATLMALILWPLVTGVLGFLVASAASAAARRWGAGSDARQRKLGFCARGTQ